MLAVGQPSNERSFPAVNIWRPDRVLRVPAEVLFLLEKNVEKLKELEQSGSRYGLERIRTLLDKLSCPDAHLKIVHVAGTNGKGSVCAYVTQMLLADGKTVGTFTSPEVYDYYDKFLLNGKPVTPVLWGKYLQKVWQIAEGMEDKPTAFERETAIALYCFWQEGLEYAVIECGLGGLQDATNAIRQKQVAVINSISLEHTAILGDTITQICYQKAGIAKNCPAVINPMQSEEGLAYLSALPLAIFPDHPTIVDGQTFDYQGEQYHLSLYGKEQCYNAVTAIEVAKLLHLSQSAIKHGLAIATLAGRVQVISANNQTYVLDGAHNPLAFAPLAEYLGHITGDKQIIFSCLSDKDVAKIAPYLAQMSDQIILVPSVGNRAMEMEKMEQAIKPLVSHLQICQSTTQALAQATANTVVVCGTFTILKEAKLWIDKRR